MKLMLTKLVLLLLLTAAATKQLSAQQYHICLKDVFSYVWQLDYTTKDHVTYATGTVDIGGGFLWNAWGWYNKTSGETELHAVNPQGDNCFSGYTDSFIYFGTGNGYHDQALGGDPVFVSSGSWISYCGGSEYSYGTYTLEDCNHAIHSKNSTGKMPALANKSGDVRQNNTSVNLKITPNPIKNFAEIQYTVANQSKVSITVYNYLQQPVKLLANEIKAAGTYTVTWDGKNSNGTNAISGLYKVVAIMDGKSNSVTMQMIR
ncbi:MAG: FlgD immunoglobulin-like domain containing protein [Parafilimonas sp.]